MAFFLISRLFLARTFLWGLSISILVAFVLRGLNVSGQDELPRHANASIEPNADVADKDGSGKDPSASLQTFIEQLGSDQFHRRKMATQRLIDAGPGAVDSLVSAMRSGDLETINRAVHCLSEIALKQPPSEDRGAWGELLRLSTAGAASRAALAKSAVEEIRQIRSIQALESLDNAGVFIGTDEFLVQSISTPRLVVRIDENWSGDLASLQWLRWVQQIEYAQIKGAAVRQQVLEQLVRMPDLKTIALVEGKVNAATLKPLQEMQRITSLEFRYIPLTPELGDEVAKIRIGVSLNLMGTGIPAEKVEQLRQSLPGLDIVHRQGGFLGVKCLSGFDVCRVSDVVAGGAAEKAGLVRGDEIVGVGDAEVNSFEDLQKAINQRMPGDEVEVRFRRVDSFEKVTLKLGKLP